MTLLNTMYVFILKMFTIYISSVHKIVFEVSQVGIHSWGSLSSSPALASLWRVGGWPPPHCVL